MKAYRTYVTIQDPQQVILSNVPFRVGQQVEIVVLGQDDDHVTKAQQLKDLFKTTQALPQAQAVQEEEINREIEAYRNGQ